jgi:hypothetical protein
MRIARIDRLVKFDSLPPGRGDGHNNDHKQAKCGERRQEPMRAATPAENSTDGTHH